MDESSVKFVGSTVTLCGSPPQSMMERIRAHISDPDNYEEGEPRPSMATLRRLETLVQDTRRINPGIFVRTPKISTFYGEIDLTWDTMRQMVRVIAHPNDQATELYILMKDVSQCLREQPETRRLKTLPTRFSRSTPKLWPSSRLPPCNIVLSIGLS